MKKGLNIGCGPVHLDNDFGINWENSDMADTESSADWKIEKKRDFTKPMDDIADESIDYIVAWHIIEHVGLHENASIIREWRRVLKTDGRIFVACPDLTKIALQIVNRQGAWREWYICMVNVFGPYNGYVGDYHKWGYDELELNKLFIDNGYINALPITQGRVGQYIGLKNGLKLGFADYNVQLEVIR